MLLSLVCTDFPITKIKKAMSICISSIQFSAPQGTNRRRSLAQRFLHQRTSTKQWMTWNLPASTYSFKQKFHLAAGTHDLAGQSILRSWQRKESRVVMLTVSAHSYHTDRIQTGAMQYHSQVSQLLNIFLQYAVTPRCDPTSNWP
jgi:hypothetical protein